MVKKQKNSRNILPIGKLKSEQLKKIFEGYEQIEKKENINDLGLEDIDKIYLNSKQRVKMGFSIGEDAAVIDMGDKFLVTKTDPITFASDEIGFYCVMVNANDIATTGAIPKWFQATILLPSERSTEQLAMSICMDIQKACKNIGVSLIGGHTEVTRELNRPIVVGSMFGEVKKEYYVETGGGLPGDAIILTKGVPLEGTSIIAREKEDFLIKKGISREIIEKAKNLLHQPGISVVKEGLLATRNFNIHTMHDPTEGGLNQALVEMAMASHCGLRIKYEDIHIFPEGKLLCEVFNLDPLRLIASGSMLIGIEEEDSNDLLDLLNEKGILAKKIGNLTRNKEFLVEKNNVLEELRYSEIDQITKIFDDKIV